MISTLDLLNANIINNCRLKANSNDCEEYQTKTIRFLEWISKEYYEQKIKVFEMYPIPDDNPIKSKINIYDGLYFNPLCNTRIKLQNETCLEIDKIDYTRCFNLISEVCLSLMRLNIHFAIFYAEGQRSPHIRIYDFNELIDMTPIQREKAQLMFWRMIMPFGTFQYADYSMFSDEHPMQLEFRPHWKYQTMFNLVFEYLPKHEDFHNMFYVEGNKILF